MKKIIAIMLLASLAISATACNSKTDDKTEVTTDTAVVNTATETADIATDIELKDRWYPEFTDHLIPSTEYGELVPFMGDNADYKAYTYHIDENGNDVIINRKAQLFGLCTKDGKIVVDAVYSDIEYFDGYYALKKFSRDVNEIQPAYDEITTFFVAKSDGSSVSENPNKAMYCRLGKNGVLGTGGVEGEEWVFIDKDGNVIADNNKRGIGNFAEILDDGTFSDDLSNDYGYNYHPYKAFDNKYVVINPENNLEGIVDKDGKVLVPCEYEQITHSADTTVMFKNGNEVTILDKDLKEVNKFTLPEKAAYIWSVGNQFVTYQSNDANKEVIYNLKGEKTDYLSVEYITWNDCYKVLTDKEEIVFDSDFNKIATIDDKTYSVYANIKNEKLFLLKLDEYRTDWENPNRFSVYDVKSGKIVEDSVYIHHPQSDTGYDGYKFYYKIDGDKITAFITETGEKFGEIDGYVYCKETPQGEMYFYKSGDTCYTLDENLKEIFSIKSENK